MNPINLAILGATGSIGTQTLDVVRTCLPQARVCALTGNKNIKLLTDLAHEFRPDMVCVPDAETAAALPLDCEIVVGADGLRACASQSDADLVINALVGQAGLAPTLAAIQAGKSIALANKEALVTAGALVMAAAREKNVRITPIDSEHSAILQCLQGNEQNKLDKLFLTASGGPFLNWPKEKIAAAAAHDALKHPNWRMGPKITIDSATLMNKGLEIIEAMWLFDIALQDIEVVVHPQSIVHSMVRFADGAVMAQLGTPDMRVPILYALTAPKRVANAFPPLDVLSLGQLTFQKPDDKRFPCLRLAIQAASTGGTLPAVMNTVNERAVEAYLKGRIKFYDISALIEGAFESYIVKPLTCIQDVWEAEAWATDYIEHKLYRNG